MRALVFLFMVVFLASAARAGDVTVSVRTSAGQPVRDAVITAYPNGQPTRGPIRFDWPLRMAQKDIRFDPFVLIVPVGGEVAFPNFDKVRHHVYSFSPGNRFELKLYGREENRTFRFMAPGAAAIGCNIHDQMVAFIRVVDTAFATKTSATGEATLRGLPAGPVTVRVWHPYLRAPKNETSFTYAAPAAGVVRRPVAVELRAAQPMAH